MNNVRFICGVGIYYHLNDQHGFKLRLAENEISATVDRFVRVVEGVDGHGSDTVLNTNVKVDYFSSSLSCFYSIQKHKFSFSIELGVNMNSIGPRNSFSHPDGSFGGFIGLSMAYRYYEAFSLVIGSRLSQPRSNFLYSNDYTPSDISGELSFRYYLIAKNK